MNTIKIWKKYKFGLAIQRLRYIAATNRLTYTYNNTIIITNTKGSFQISHKYILAL